MHSLLIITPLVIICALGFASARFKWLEENHIAGLSKFTFNFTIPAFLFYKMLNADLTGALAFDYFISFYAPLLIIYFLAWCINFFFHEHHKGNVSASASFALGASYSNTVIIALPVLLALFGDKVISLVFLLITFHSALLFTLTSLLAVFDKDENNSRKIDWHKLGKQTVNNPIIMSITGGLVFNVLTIDLPEFVDVTLETLSAPAITLALFLLGCSLNKYHIRTQKYFISVASVIKLFVFPALVYFTAKELMNLPELMTVVVVIMSASPTGVNAYLIAALQGKHQDTVAGTVVASTVLSTITIPLWLSFLM